MKKIKRILDVAAMGRLKLLLVKKGFKFRHRFGGYEEAIRYTTNGLKKIHFLLFSHQTSNPSVAGATEVHFHIDTIYEGWHSLSRIQGDYEGVLRWLELPDELAFDLGDVFLSARERWVTKQYRHQKRLEGLI